MVVWILPHAWQGVLSDYQETLKPLVLAFLFAPLLQH
jgi:hypothetical protein